MAGDVAGEDEADAATRAFEGLRAEIAVLRYAVEAIEPALREGASPDYSPTLGALAQSMEAMAARVEAVAAHTGAAVPAEVARREIARVYDASLKPARGDLERATREVADAAHVLQTTLGRVRARDAQRARVIRAAAIGAAVGVVAVPLLAMPLARALPFGTLPDRIAAYALGEDRWTAGAGLMSRADPGRWDELVEGYTAGRAAGGDLRAKPAWGSGRQRLLEKPAEGCLDAARKTGREQRCAVTVRPEPVP